MVRKGFRNLYTVLIFLFLYAPIIVLIIYSFNESKSRGAFTGFTLKWYQDLFSNRAVISALTNTMIIAVVTTIVATILGTLAAIGIHYSRKGPFKQMALNLNYLPILNPDVVIAVSLIALYRFMGLDFGLSTVLLSHITFCTPYVVLAVLPKLKQMNANLAEAAMDLGAKPMYALRKVIVPEIMPGIVTGALLAFTLSVDDFAISFFTTGHGVQNLSILIFSMARRGINPVINALSTFMLIGFFILLLIINRIGKSEEEEERDL
ncbi:ABC transporter permease [Proteiniclasticum sp. SCR006]|uniref:ABC transporter permease n=1 Tax=Proteiniclasticum aestuarii TaxID=2817862 RepID=A0A939KG90_9CLOT|nr:ABC transporter permease [Proteiniclasticum aestuarii]MBO1264164.1 ABC transporter permease [Proteiniclasticum aestuarii]